VPEADLIDRLRLTTPVRNPELLAFISECILELKTSRFRVNVKIPRFMHAIAGCAIRDNAAWEPQRERDGFLYFAEARIVSSRRNPGVDLDWLLAREVTRSV
jgi:hypothetical protein